MTSDTSPESPFRVVRRGSPYPLYWQVEHDLRQRIESGIWHPGDRLPSEEELSDLYGASRITIRQAMGNIASDGLVSREPGRGTFVQEQKRTQAMRLTASFTEEMMKLGVRIETKVIRQETEPASLEVAEAFGIGEGDQVYRVDRLRLTGGKPFAVQRARLPISRFPRLATADLSGSLYQHLGAEYGVVPTDADEVIHVCLAKEVEGSAELLDVGASHPCFLIDRTSFDDDGPVDFSRSVVRGDRYQIHLGLRRN